MYWAKISDSNRTLVYSAAVLCLAVAALLYGAELNTADASPGTRAPANHAAMVAPSVAFPANAGTLGAIPDGGIDTACGSDGSPRDVTFTVSGISSAPSNVEVSMTFSPAHTWRGDLGAVLIAPNATSFTLFKYIGSTTAAGCGSSADFAGPYNFKDSAAGTNIWTVIATPTTAGDYRTTGAGGAGQTNPPPVTNLTAAFSGIPTSNGTWTLRVTDGGGGDTGSVSAATLTLTGAAAPMQHVVDFDGNGKTDFATVRNTGGGPSGQVTWYIQSDLGVNSGFLWGIATDFFVPADYDGDGKTDIAVWRPGAATVATWYILQSNGFTLRQEAFGQTGDDSTVVGDYSGDGKADLAVYRSGAAAGQQSTWYYRSALAGPVTFVPWGQNGDFPAPGDYDGDGKYDFVIQRNFGGGQAAFWTLKSNLTVAPLQVFGTPTDVIVPGDYDGDGKTDIATIRGSGGAIIWNYRPSGGGADVNFVPFGASATDFATQGDYDGDGKTDRAIWRPNADPTQNYFWVLGSTAGVSQREWGQNGDYPVANFNSH